MNGVQTVDSMLLLLGCRRLIDHGYVQGGSGRPTLSRDWSVGGALLCLLDMLVRLHFSNERAAGQKNNLIRPIVRDNLASKELIVTATEASVLLPRTEDQKRITGPSLCSLVSIQTETKMFSVGGRRSRSTAAASALLAAVLCLVKALPQIHRGVPSTPKLPRVVVHIVLVQ